MADAARRSPRFRVWTWSHRATALTFLALLVLGRQAWFPWLKGSITAVAWFDQAPFIDPLSALEVLVASRGFTITLLIGLAATCAVGAVMGRVFCGWLCPLGMILDFNDQLQQQELRRRLLRRGVRLPRLSFPKDTKYWLLLACLLTSLVSGLPVFTTISPINLTVLAVVHTPGIGLAIMGLLIAIECWSPRLFCRSLCPLGGLYALIGRAAPFTVRVRGQRSCPSGCQLCTLQCPMGIDVLQDHVRPKRRSVRDGECTRCGTCVDGCPAAVIRLGV